VSILKVIDVSAHGMSGFGQFLDYLAKNRKLPIEVSTVTEFSPELFKEAQALNIDPHLSSLILPKMPVIPTQVRNTGVLDSFFFDDGKWIPRLFLFEAARQVLVDQAKDMDIRHPGFVIGDDASALTMISVLIHLGFAEIYVVSENENALNHSITAIARNYIGVKILPLPATELTMQALSASVVINCESLQDKKSLLNDLSYFNFMKTSGLILDLQWIKGGGSPLLEEAVRADLRIVETSRVVGLQAMQWLEKLSIADEIKVEDLEADWKEFIKQFEG
jgi:shikimate dehydrogenase